MKTTTAFRSLVLISVFSLLNLFGCNDSFNSLDENSNEISQAERGKHHSLNSLIEEDYSPQVGVNYNGLLNFISFEDLERTQTIWVRGFVDFFQFYPDPEKLYSDERIEKYLELNDEGYKTLLNIKWNFNNKSFPEPGSEELDRYKKYLKKLLTRVWPKTDIIVAGNEPFIESKFSERDDRLVKFYKEIAHEIKDFREKQGTGHSQREEGKHVPIFIGAFNNLYLPRWRNQAEGLFAFAREESWIEGVDLHIHHGGTLQLRRALRFAANNIRDDQKFLVTEYSLMKHFRNKMNETIPESFAEEYEWNSDTKNYEYIDYALKNQVIRPEWVDFLNSSYWFENRTRYLRNSYQEFTKFDKFYIATYAMRQSFPFNRDFTENTDPWILNGLYANRTVIPHPEDGRTQFNYAWINDFRRIQQGVFDN